MVLKKYSPAECAESYDAAQRYRRTLNDEMKPRTWLSSIFGGDMFIRSHPRPMDRIAIAEQNILKCFVMTKAIEIGRLNQLRRDSDRA